MKKLMILFCAAIALTVWSQVVVTTNSLTQIRRLKQLQVDFPPGGGLIMRGYFFQEQWNGTNLVISHDAPIISVAGTNLDAALTDAGFTVTQTQLRNGLIKLMMSAWTNANEVDTP